MLLLLLLLRALSRVGRVMSCDVPLQCREVASLRVQKKELSFARSPESDYFCLYALGKIGFIAGWIFPASRFRGNGVGFGARKVFRLESCFKSL